MTSILGLFEARSVAYEGGGIMMSDTIVGLLRYFGRTDEPSIRTLSPGGIMGGTHFISGDSHGQC